MKILKKFKQYFGNTEIDKICKKYKIKNYTINSDNSVDVDDNVKLRDKKLKSIPLNFNIVNGNFDCGNNQLTSLQYSPQYMESGNFSCGRNKIESLQYCTELIRSDFYCYNNKLTSLEYHPTVYGEFHCQYNQINTFENFYYYKEDVYFDGNPIWDIYELFNDMKLIELTWDYGFEWKGEIDLYKLDIFLKETEHEYHGSLREYFEEKEYKWKLINEYIH